jgi:hypothetical protein
MERETGIEPATFSLARRCSTTEPLPLIRRFCMIKISYQRQFVNSLKFLLVPTHQPFTKEPGDTPGTPAEGLRPSALPLHERTSA